MRRSLAADGYAEREAAKVMIKDARQAATHLGAEITASEGYKVSVQKRKLIEQGLGWAKTVGRMRQVMKRGLKRVDQMCVLTMAAYNLTRMRSLAKIRLQAALGAKDARKLDSKRRKRPKRMANFGMQIGKLKNERLDRHRLLIC